MFDTTGLTQVKMRRRGDWQGAYYVNGDVCVAKTCSTCHEIKPAEDFGSQREKKYGLSGACLVCKAKAKSEYNRAYRALPVVRERQRGHGRRSYIARKSRTAEEVYSDQIQIGRAHV